MTNVHTSIPSDLEAWIALAREVEPLFGPMAGDASFRAALKQAIQDEHAFCLRQEPDAPHKPLAGGIVISPDTNEIAWLAVSAASRGKGIGTALLGEALAHLTPQEAIVVQTFDGSVPEGQAARSLYARFGFVDLKHGGDNPAGLPTVIMERPATGNSA
ncbi:GNAT family N-acetyltransferase [Desulfoluna spongiiphila]|uniref:Ribosomal protein S18 acetylase RimI n=1 Tax=Desulfoluna spongiiphila TaxID=419481 RepID=A0A1G5HC78_9BACT|nr:GNAT family N-acetyltransferase [Desulfoluna spongiiphila]SCY61475.1 Ribosomal protein S18 acetylase RimI [Desulfoluna spongiiphila]VVS94626.1 acyl-coa n-acyltransferase [Desulfoluna spongiiphila]